MMTPLTVVHVGCGAMASAWLRGVAPLSGVRVVGLADLNLEAAAKRRDEFAPHAEISTDAVAMIEALKPDVVFNCTVPAAHHPISMAALRVGAHVLSEKPLANSVAEAREIVETAAAQRRLFAVTQNYRYKNGPKIVRETLDAGNIGRITSAMCDFFIGAHFGGFRDVMDHVLLLDMSIHHFDLSRFFTGGTPASVFCQEWNPPGSWYKHGAAACAMFRFKEGIEFNYRGMWCAEGATTDWNGHWRIIGTEGTLIWEGTKLSEERVVERGSFLSKVERREIVIPEEDPQSSSHGDIILEFIDCIESGKEPSTRGSDNIHSLAMVFGAIESAEKQGIYHF